MGGFLYNGCGAADTVKKMLLLKTEMCPNCRKECEFYLAKIQMKIHVIFIPTVPLNTKYGIVCSKCKTGRYISEEQMRQIMSADDRTRAYLYDGIMHPERSAQTVCEEQIPEAEKAAPKQIEEKAAVCFCPQCGKPASDTALFCGYCGAGLQAPAAPVQEAVTHEKPDAAERVSAAKDTDAAERAGAAKDTDAAERADAAKGMDAAGEAGAQKETEASDEAAEAAVRENEKDPSDSGAGAWICPLCSTSNPADTDRCQLCGERR